MTVAYDMDGVLSEVIHLAGKPWRHMNGEERRQRRDDLLRLYESVSPLHVPEEARFLVITARKDEPEVRKVTEAWLERCLPGRVSGLYMLKVSRTIENVVAFKAGVIQEQKATDFTEDNLQVVRALRRLKLACRVWHFTPEGYSVLDGSVAP